MQLSIIIPVYNCTSFLKHGFETLKPLYASKILFEIIYVNDGSTDDSLKILKEIELDYDFVKVLDQENQGSSGARNTAIAIAQGKYIQFLDADDYLDVKEILQLLTKANQLNVDLVGFRLDEVDEKGNQLKIRAKQNVKFNEVITGKEALVSGYQPSSICVFLFKTDFLNKLGLRIYSNIAHMDVEFMCRVMMVATSVLFMDKIAYHYLQREGSITKPKTLEKLHKLLHDEVVVAGLIKENLANKMDNDLKNALIKNYNSVVWNLLWRFMAKPKEVSLIFKLNCIAELEQKKLYPIKGALKTNFQRVTVLFFNNRFLLSSLIKIRS